jgi:predicted RNA-binding Zn-ribbon protein involved in translation (DUF1610 family)
MKKRFFWVVLWYFTSVAFACRVVGEPLVERYISYSDWEKAYFCPHCTGEMSWKDRYSKNICPYCGEIPSYQYFFDYEGAKRTKYHNLMILRIPIPIKTETERKWEKPVTN